MVQYLSIIFFSWISSIFVGFFKSSRFFCVTLYNRNGEWKLLYQNARCHSLQDCKDRHTQTCSDESSFVPVTYSVQNCITCFGLLTLRCAVINIIHYVWGEKLHRDQNTTIFLRLNKNAIHNMAVSSVPFN